MVLEAESVSDAAEQLQSIIIAAATAAIPQSTATDKFREPWLPKPVTQLKRQRNALYGQLKRDRNNPKLISAEKRLQKRFRKERKIYLSKFFADLITKSTTYSENIGCVGITTVASRITFQLCACMLLFLGMITKFSAIIGTLPDVLVGGILTISFTMVGGVGLSSIQMVDLRLTRNIAILGMSVTFGIMIPLFFRRFPLDTGIQELDNNLTILLGIQMLVGGLVGFFLDNTVPGATRIQRGLPGASEKTAEGQTEDHENPYAFPEPLRKFVEKFSFLNRLPFIPKKEYD